MDQNIEAYHLIYLQTAHTEHYLAPTITQLIISNDISSIGLINGSHNKNLIRTGIFEIKTN